MRRLALLVAVLAMLAMAGTSLLAQQAAKPDDPEDAGLGPQILTSDLARRQTIEADQFSATFLFVDEVPVVDVRINGEPQPITQDTSVIITRQFDNRKARQIIEVAATNVSGQTRKKSFLVANPKHEQELEELPRYYKIEDRWDPQWQPLSGIRAGGAAVAIDKSIFIFGGYTSVRYDYDGGLKLSKDPSEYMSTSEQYDPNFRVDLSAEAILQAQGKTQDVPPGKAAPLTGAPPFSTLLSAAVVDRKAYVFESRQKAHEFDARAKRWRSLPSPIRLNRIGPAAAANKKIYIFGGLFGIHPAQGNPRVTPSLQVWEFDPATGRFTSKRSMPTARGGAAACTVRGIVYVFGGYDGEKYLDSVESYNPAQNSWQRLRTMPGARAYAGCVVVNDLVYVISGYASGIVGDKVVGTMEMYDPATDSWRSRRPVPTARQDAAIVTIEGAIYIMGGHNGAQPVTQVEVYR